MLGIKGLNRMNMNIRKKRYTFLVIPEAEKAVFSFRVPLIAISVIPMTLIILMIAVFVLYQQNSRHLADVGKLEKTNTDKNNQIQKLHNDILSLSRQAEQVQTKVEELRQLEEELRGLTGNEVSRRDDSSAVALSSPVHVNENTIAPESGAADPEEHMGGILYPVEEADIPHLVSSAETNFYELDIQMKELFAGLTKAKEEVLAYQHLRRITPSIWPTASRKITSEFGIRDDPFTGSPSRHTGIDIAGPYNEDVYATADGVVKFVGYDRGSGNNIIIDHSAGIQTRYMHLSKYLVKVGQKVKKGEVIGHLGSTGRSTGPHLHYEVIKNGKKVDPMPYLKSSKMGEN